jgi:hypothetical protein
VSVFLAGMAFFLLCLCILGGLAYLLDPYGDERRDARNRNDQARPR